MKSNTMGAAPPLGQEPGNGMLTEGVPQVIAATLQVCCGSAVAPDLLPALAKRQPTRQRASECPYHPTSPPPRLRRAQAGAASNNQLKQRLAVLQLFFAMFPDPPHTMLEFCF